MQAVYIMRKPRRQWLTIEEIHKRYKPDYYGKERNITVKTFEKRLQRLEATQNLPFLDVLKLIAAGRHYSDLTDTEQKQYAAYQGVPCRVLEDVEAAVSGNLDFTLEQRRPKPTQEQIQKIAAEVESAVFGN